MMHPYKRGQGFSLVEVVLALGITTFALVALVGLLAVGIGNNRESVEDTQIAAMTTDVISGLRARAFEDLGDATTYYDFEGKVLNGEDGAIFRCDVALIDEMDDDGSVYLKKAQIGFQWPVGAVKPQKRTITADIARYR